MSVLRLTSKKTLPLLLQALSMRSFTQTELAKRTKISIGRVNKIITWLKEKEVITKEQGQYYINQPNRLAELIANQQNLTKTRTYLVSLDKSALQKAMKEKKITLCLSSALRLHEKKEIENNVQIIDAQVTRDFLEQLPRGEQYISLFAYDDAMIDEGKTSIIQTIIDLKSIGEGCAAESCAITVWGTRQ